MAPHLVVSVKRLIGNRVPAFVLAEIDVPVGLQCILGWQQNQA